MKVALLIFVLVTNTVTQISSWHYDYYYTTEDYGNKDRGNTVEPPHETNDPESEENPITQYPEWPTNPPAEPEENRTTQYPDWPTNPPAEPEENRTTQYPDWHTNPPPKEGIWYWGTCSSNTTRSTWHMYNNNCYLWSGEGSKANWFRAELNCRNEGGHLVSIENQEEARIVEGLTLCKNPHWLGLVKTSTTSYGADGWSWWDNTTHYSYSNLRTENVTGKDCVASKTVGSWVNTYCSAEPKYTWVCKRSSKSLDVDELEAETFQVSQRPPKYACPYGWIYYQSNCYWFSKAPANYFHAQLQCQEMASEVVTIHGQLENEFIQAINGCENKYWIGLERANPCVSQRWWTKNHCWEWTDLKPVYYSNWGAKYPKDDKDYECTHSNGDWENSLKCNVKLNFICKRNSNF